MQSAPVNIKISRPQHDNTTRNAVDFVQNQHDTGPIKIALK
jgi:hypothetical protein